MKETGHGPAWEDIKIVYQDSNQKKRKNKFKEGARRTFHRIDLLMNKDEEHEIISNLWNSILNNNN